MSKTTKILNIELDQHLHKQIKIASAHAGATLRAWVRLAIIEKLRREANREIEPKWPDEKAAGDLAG